MEEADWIELFRARMPRLYGRVSRRVGGDRALSEDVTQETWLRAVRTWSLRGVPDDPDAWLLAVAQNLLRQHFRRRRTRAGVAQAEAALADVAAPDCSDGTGAASDQAARAQALQRGLARLRPDLSALVAEHHFDARPLAELAARRGLTERAVEGRLHRARRQLARHLRADGLDPDDLV